MSELILKPNLTGGGRQKKKKKQENANAKWCTANYYRNIF
jgi:hypothetical protein